MIGKIFYYILPISQYDFSTLDYYYKNKKEKQLGRIRRLFYGSSTLMVLYKIKIKGWFSNKEKEL